MKTLLMLASTALLLAASCAHLAPRAAAKAFQQTQAVQQKQNNVPSTGAFQITGRVVNSITNAPVAGAYVVINAASGSSLSRTVRAGTDGSFAFTEILAGRYVLTARRKGYVEQMYLQHERFTTAILVGPSLNSENLVFPLPPEGVIFGAVTDEAGEPVQFARMLLFREDSQNGRRVKRLQAREHTDDEGQYRFAFLPSGDYYLVVLAEPWYAMYARANHSSMRSAHAQKHSLNSSNLDVVFPITYYPNGTDANGAAPIRVETGSGVRADMRLVPVPALHMLLEVGGTDPETYTQVLVTQKILGTYEDKSRVSAQLVLPERASGDDEDDDAVQPSGPIVLELTGLRPGPSVIQVTANNAKDSAHSGKVSKSVPVDPTDGQTLDLRGTARAGVVSGIVRLEGNASPPPGVLVFLRNASNGSAFRQDVDATGNFDFSSDEIEPGVYELFAAAPGGLELRSVSANGTKLTGRKIEISNESDLRLVLTLARGVNARVKGIVQRGGKPAPGMMVVLVPEDLRELGEYRRDQSDSDGSFSLNGVTPGKYTVVALRDWDLEWGKPEVIQGYLAGGTPVEVAGGEERDIRVTAK